MCSRKLVELGCAGVLVICILYHVRSIENIKGAYLLFVGSLSYRDL